MGKVKESLYFLWAILIFLFFRKRKKQYDLVIVRTDLIGDFVIWHDSIAAYKNKYIEKKVLLICTDVVVPLAEQESFFSEILCYNKREFANSFMYYTKFIIKLRNISSTELINPMWARHRVGDFFSMVVSSDRKIALEGNCQHDLFYKFRNYIYTKLINVGNSVSEVQTVEEFTKQTIFTSYVYGNSPLSTNIDIPISLKDYVVVALSASKDKRVWDMSRFAKLIDEIPINYTVVLSGAGQKDIIRAECNEKSVKVPERIINLINKTSIAEMIPLIQRASFVIGNDSAAIHIAAAVHVPSLCLFHGAQFKRFLPYPEKVPSYARPRIVYYKMDCFGCEFHCKKPFKSTMLPCLDAVTVEMAKKELVKLLKSLNNEIK